MRRSKMNIRMQNLVRITSVLLVLAVLLSGLASSVAALEARQEPLGRVVQGWGDFPRLPVVAPATDGSAPALYLVQSDQATQLLEFEGLRIGDDSVIVRPAQVLDTPICGTMNVRDKDPYRSHAVQGFFWRIYREVER
jgi:hypothetical protein